MFTGCRRDPSPTAECSRGTQAVNRVHQGCLRGPLGQARTWAGEDDPEGDHLAYGDAPHFLASQGADRPWSKCACLTLGLDHPLVLILLGPFHIHLGGEEARKSSAGAPLGKAPPALTQGAPDLLHGELLGG